MNIIDIILSTEVIAGLVIVASLAMTVRSVLFFTREASALGPKLTKIEANLTKFRDGMGERKQVVENLNTVVTPLRNQEERLRDYYDGLRNMELEHDRTEQKVEEEEEEQRKKRVQRKKMGFR